MKAISVIIPTFNRAQFLKRAILSVLNQVDFLGEVIVVDDGSTDNTQEVVSQFTQSQPVIYEYINNSGPAAARNYGVDKSQYDLIAFLDSDDHWKRQKLSKQLRLLNQHPDYSICHTYEKWIRRGEHLNQKNIHLPRHGDIFHHCLKLCAVGMSTVIMKKALFLEFDGLDNSLPCCEDYDLWLRISHKHKFLLLPEPLTVKEGGREDQLSAQYRVGMDKYRIYAIIKLLKTCGLSSQQRLLAVREMAKKCRIYGNGCIKHGREAEGKTYHDIADKYLLEYDLHEQ